MLREVADLTRRASELVTTWNGLRDAWDTAGALGKYNDAVELYRQALQKVETHNQTYPQNTIENSEIFGWKSVLEWDIQRYKEEIGQQQRQKETEQQAQEARGQRLDELQRQIQEEWLVVTIDNTITPENVTEAHLTGIEEYIKTARAQKQELDNRAAEEKKHNERTERAKEGQFGGLLSYDRSGEVFKVNIAYWIRNIVARDINSLHDLQTNVQSEAQRVYTDIFSSTVSGKKQILSTEVATDRQLTLNRESNKNIQSFDAWFAARKKRETVDHASVVDEMTKYNLLWAWFLEGDINTYTWLIQDATNYNEQMVAIDTEIDQQAQAMLVWTTEIIYDAENNSFTVKWVTLPRAEVMWSETSLDDIVDEANEKLTEWMSVSYDAKNNMFTYKGARVSSADIQSADEFAIWVKEVGMQIAQQRDRLDLAEWSYDIRWLQTQITHLNTYISNPEDGFKLVDRKAEQQSNKKKKKNDPPHTPEREVSYTSLLSPHSVPLKEYITVDGIVDVPWLQKEIRGQIEKVYATKSEAEQARLVSIYTAIWWVAVNLVDR